MRDSFLSWLGIRHAQKIGEMKLVIWNETFSNNEMIR